MSRYPRSNKKVTFNLPNDHNDQPPSILRRQTRGNIDLDPISQPALSRRSSLPATTSMSRSSRLRGLEALHGLREYIKDACNFHGGEYRRALAVPSVDALCKLTSYISKLRGDKQNRMTHADEKILHRLVDCSKRHPHEQLTAYEEFTSRHARNSVKAHRKRARREADFHLLQFVSRQLRLPVRALRELSTRQRIERETEAFKERIMKFYGPRLGGNSSAPQSPAGRPLTAPRSPATDPIRWEMLHGRLSGTPHDLFPDEMDELALPASYDRRTHAPPRTHAIRTPPQQPLASPYVPVHQTPPQGYQPSPYVYPGIPVAGYQRTPPQPPVSMPYNTQAYGPQAYVNQGQAFAPQPMNLPQSVATPQQATMQGGAVPGMTIPPSMPARQAPVAPTQQHTPLQQPMQTPLQQPMQTPQQQPLQHPGQAAMSHTPQQTTLPQPMSHAPQQQPLQHAAQAGRTQPGHTPQQQPLPQPQQAGMTLPPSQQQTPQQGALPHPQQGMARPASGGQMLLGQAHHPLQQGVHSNPGSQGFILPVATAVPAVVHTVPPGYGMPQQQYVQGQYAGVSYPQAGQSGQVGQVGQQYQAQQGQHGQAYYGRNGGDTRQQQQQG